MNKKEKLIDYLQELSDSELVYMHNEYCYSTNHYDDEIFLSDMFDEIFSSYEPWEIACKIHFGDFNPSYDYFKFNGYANIVSLHKWDIDKYVEIVDIVDYILENDVDFDDNNIRHVLDDIDNK